jgi:hypothetical protein
MTSRTLLILGALLSPLGVALSLLAPEWLGAATTIAGVGCALLGLHRLGRSGPDPARVLSR